nr:unnamed protein product [Spirometra erinaceieuropaei]
MGENGTKMLQQRVAERICEQITTRKAALENKFRKLSNPASSKNDKLVHNLSSKELTEEQMQVLRHVVSFNTDDATPVETNADLDLPLSPHETIKAVQQLSSRKAPGSDAIPADICKHGGRHFMDHLGRSSKRCGVKDKSRRMSRTPQSCIFINGKETASSATTILRNITGKILSRILLNRLNHHRKQGEVSGDADPPPLYLHGSDESPRHGEPRRTVENHAEIRLSRTIHKDGASDPCWHDGANNRQWAVSEAFVVTNGVKQDCVPVPANFSLMFFAILIGAYRDERSGIRVAYKADGQLLNHRRMHFQSHVSAASIHELLFANDCALSNTSKRDMQRSMYLFATARENSGPIIDTEKTVVMHQRPPDAVSIAP